LARHKIRRLGSVRHWHSLARNRRIRRPASLSRSRPVGAFSSVLFSNAGSAHAPGALRKWDR